MSLSTELLAVCENIDAQLPTGFGMLLARFQREPR